MAEHTRQSDLQADMPKFLRWAMVFIDRLGFPIFAFLLMCYIVFVGMKNITESLTQNTQVLAALVTKIDRIDQ